MGRAIMTRSDDWVDLIEHDFQRAKERQKPGRQKLSKRQRLSGRQRQASALLKATIPAATSQTSDAVLDLELHPAEVAVLIDHHSRLATKLRASGDHAAHDLLQQRVVELEFALALAGVSL